VRYPFALSFTVLAVLTTSGPATAADSEREALARLAHELEALAPLVDAAEAGADRTERVRFRYDWLRRDIRRVREGVLEHATSDQAEPRRYEPLRGDYRR
jgi:RAQPRD family integrative conjugative element protein